MQLPQKKIYDLKEARQKIEGYCAYQERSHKQVKEKLVSYGLRYDVADELLIELIDHNFLNETRFAQALARGKFNIKGWGKHKIRQHLRQHFVSDYNIKKGLAEIDEKDYVAKFYVVAEKRWNSLKGESPQRKRQKFMTYLYNRGFEKELIYEFLKEVQKK